MRRFTVFGILIVISNISLFSLDSGTNLNKPLNYTEKSFLLGVLKNSYDVKNLQQKNESSYQNDIAILEPYSPALKAGYTFTYFTNAAAEQVGQLFNHSVYVGISKLFETGTVLSGEVGTGFSSSSVKSYEFSFVLSKLIETYAETGASAPYLKVGVVQPLLKGGFGNSQLMLSMGINKNIQQINRFGIKMALERIAYGALLQYHKMLFDMAVYLINKKSLSSANSLYNKYYERYKIGAISEGDLYKLKKLKSDTELVVKKAEESILSDIAVISIMLNTNLTKDSINLEESFLAESGDNSNFNVVYAEAVNNKSDIIQAKLVMENSKTSQKITDADAMPQLDLVMNYQYSGYSHSSDFSQATQWGFHDFFAGLTFSIPFGSPANEAKALSKQYELKAAEFDLEAKKMQLKIDLIDSISEIGLQTTIIKDSQGLIDINKVIVANVQKEFDVGKVGSRELLLAQEDLRIAQIKYFIEVFNYKLMLLDLQLKKGSLLKTYGIELKEI
ncbi:MAG: TolC family protein [Brevinematales bacterium]|nr:TolC family protein [Brevinematales bacterium]